MADIPSYGLDPSIVSYLQGGGATPMPDQVSAVDPAIMGSVARDIVTQPPPPPPPPPPTDHLTVVDPSGPLVRAIGAGVPTPPPPPPPPPQKIGDTGPTNEAPAYGLHPAVLSSIQNGFNPLPIGATASQPDITPTGQRPADIVAGTINTPTDAQIAQGNAAVAKRQAFDNSSEGLAQKSDAEQRAALAKEDQANQESLAAEQTKNAGTVAALQASQQRQADQAKIDAAKNAEDQANVAKYTQQYAQQVKDAADYKVDTNRDVGLGGIIAIALSGVGNALDHYHGPNAAAQIIQNRIQQRIDDQWRQKQALGDKAAGTKSVLDQFRGMADSDRQAQSFQTAAELQKTAQQIQLIGAQSANPQAKANADATAATLMQKSAAITAGEAQRKAQADRDAQDQKQRAFENSLQSRAQNRADAELAFRQKQWQDQLDAAKNEAAAKGDKATADQIEQVQNEGVFDPRTGDPILTPNGQAKMDHADRLEVAARALPADQAKAMQQEAAQLRQDAAVNDIYRIKDPTERKDLRESIGANQELIDTIQNIKDTLGSDPSSMDRSTWAGLKTAFESAKADWIAAHHGKPSSREFEAISDMFGADPASVLSRVTSQGKMKSALDTLQQYATLDGSNVLKRHGIKTPWQPRATQNTNAQLSGKTSLELGEGATPGVAAGLNPIGDQGFAAKGGRAAARVVFGGEETDPVTAAENKAPLSQSGLAPADEQTVTSAINRYQNAPDRQRAEIVDQLAAYAQSPRPSIASGVIALLRSQPEVYRAVLSQLPKAQQDELRQIDRAGENAALPGGPMGNIPGVR